MSWMKKRGVSPRKPRAAGFGLIESMVVLAILAAGAACAAPAFASWRMRDRVEAVSRGWLALLQHGRDQAVRRGVQVTLCQGRLHSGAHGQGRDCAGAAPHCGDGRMAGPGDWSCAQLVSAGSDGRTAVPLTQVSFDADISVLGDAKPVRFIPPAGRIAGGPRHFEIGLRRARGERQRDDRRGGDRQIASEIRSESERRCVLVAASGRVRVQRGQCGRA